MISAPTGVDPVKPTFLTSTWSTIACPARRPEIKGCAAVIFLNGGKNFLFKEINVERYLSHFIKKLFTLFQIF